MLKTKFKVRIVDYFDRVLKKADRAKLRTMKRGGALVRQIARRSIRKRKKGTSPPGKPPFSHVSSGGIRNLIFYEYEPRSETMVIGPKKTSDSENAISALEHGGRSKIRIPKSIQRRIGKKKLRVMIKKRPYMQPALEKFSKTYPDLWKDAIS